MNALVPMNAVPAMTVSDVERVALAIANGGLFGSKDPNAVLTLCLLAQAEGQHPAVVFRDYHIIQGKPAKKAEAMLRDFLNAGGKVEWHKLDDTCADATFSHPSGSARIDWTVERANKAGISTPMWKKYPRQMLRSRVISEGVRTVYPGATSGLYVEEEVRDFTPAAEPETPHNPQTGEIIEPLKGISKIKERLRALMAAGDADITLEKFNELVGDNKADLTAIKEHNHSWWTGDGEDFEGFKSWIIRRRAELATEDDGIVQGLIESLNKCETKIQLQNWLAGNGDVVESLDGADSRKFQLVYDLRASLIDEQDRVSA